MWNGKVRDYTKDNIPKFVEEPVVILNPRDANDLPIQCDQCREYKRPLLKLGSLFRIKVCKQCLEAAFTQILLHSTKTS
jgi:hypothetical protein